MLNDRFWSKVKTAGNGCLEWQANRNNKGYGMFSVNSYVGNRLAHRLAYEDAYGPIPAGVVIMHRCDNPACVNPAHLEAGTLRQNSQDMARKGRGVARLQPGDVVRLRRDYIAGVSRQDLAKRYRISIRSVDDFVYGRSWQHLLGKYGCPTLEELQAAKRTAPAAKITAETAREIRARLEAGETGRALAREYGLTFQTVSDIKLRKIWKEP